MLTWRVETTARGAREIVLYAVPPDLPLEEIRRFPYDDRGRLELVETVADLLRLPPRPKDGGPS
jgi:hypothetical protein